MTYPAMGWRDVVIVVGVALERDVVYITPSVVQSGVVDDNDDGRPNQEQFSK